MRDLARQTAAERPAHNVRWSATAIPLLADAVHDVRTALLVLLGAVLFLLILCCVNIANLYLMRSYDRARELSLRHALGASRGRLVQQLVVESLLLTLTGGLLGILLAYAGVRTLLDVLPLNFPLPRLAQAASSMSTIAWALRWSPSSINPPPECCTRMKTRIGKQLVVDWDGPPEAQIVGIAADSRFEGVEAQPEPFVFLPNAQRPSMFWGLVIRTPADPGAMTAAVREAMRSVDPGQGMLETSTMDQRIANSVAQPRLQTILLGSFGVLALVLACIGIYGVLAYAVSQRRREMGVRLALGASPATVLGEILSGGMRLTGLGVLIGLSAALALTRFLVAMLYSVRPTDPTVFAAAIAILLLVAGVACYVPARRAARVDPMVVLREE